MKELICKITSIRNFGNKKVFSIDKVPSTPKPGQFFLAHDPNHDINLVPIYLFATRGEIYFSFPPNNIWDIGSILHIRGPIGEGFRNLEGIQNMLLIDIDSKQHVLYSLMEDGILHNKNIAYYVEENRFSIPPSVEIITSNILTESIQWADFIGIEISRENIPNYFDLLQMIKSCRVPCELSVYCPILCSGKADCMICSLKTKNGWVKTCQQGQIFDIYQLEFE